VIREMREELGISIEEAGLAPLVFASHCYPAFHLLMPLFLCRRWKGGPRPNEGQNIAWVHPSELASSPMPPADLPLIAHISTLLAIDRP
jgi:8-oxo-dGTP diphosphatase